MTAAATEDRAIAEYHDLLAGGLAADSQGWLEENIQRRDLTFGGRPVCTVVRPRWMTPEEYVMCRDRAAIVLRAFSKAHRAALADDGVRAQLRLMDWEEQLVGIDPGFAAASPTSRLDAFFVDGGKGLRFTEYNAETPAGAAYNDALTELFEAMPVMREFQRTHHLRPLPARSGVLRSLLGAFAEWSGGHARPKIAILDWREVPTYSEFLLFERYFASQGLECKIVDPREVEYRDGVLRDGDFEISLIYKRVLLHELVERCGIDGPVVRAVRDRAVCMVNPFSCKLMHKKASLAVLSDERNARLFSAEESEAIEAHIPWTRVVEERQTMFGGKKVDLPKFIRENRERFVLKPNDEYGGKGIVLGWEATDAEWEAGLAAAKEEPYIVQDRITLPTEAYPSVVDGELKIFDRMLDTAPFVVDGAYTEGCMTRLGTAALLNVTAGGGSNVPTYVIEPR
ncbi:MAG: circularly permuted type 2 ATP-grasp protein [Gemmatimonadota bacterium]|nr:circularly permuted type 2 ATP-grasp protein [Gemmatimonadota bacterium]